MITITSTSTLPAPTSTTTFTEIDSTTVTSTFATDTTTTSTTTVAAGVSTVPIPSGFQYPSPTPGAPQKRAIEPVAGGGALIKGRATPTTKSPHCSGSPPKYPSKVTCYELVETFIPTTITKTAKTTTTKFAPTPTATSTASTTSTVTVDASTTITTSTTTTTTLTATQTDTITTSTITQTATYTPPATSTFYAACATSANQVSSDYEGRTLRLLDTGSASAEGFYTDNAYDCCELLRLELWRWVRVHQLRAGSGHHLPRITGRFWGETIAIVGIRL